MFKDWFDKVINIELIDFINLPNSELNLMRSTFKKADIKLYRSNNKDKLKLLKDTDLTNTSITFLKRKANTIKIIIRVKQKQ
jgi:hypothetical protein